MGNPGRCAGRKRRAQLAVTALMIVCLSACGTSPAPEQAWDEQDNRGGQQAQLDAQAIMVGMEQARIRAALLARTGR